MGNTADNLRASVAGETHEYTDMYPGMAKTARDEGFDEIADWFETLAKAERSHANRFQKHWTRWTNPLALVGIPKGGACLAPFFCLRLTPLDGLKKSVNTEEII